ncbi:hypothetical protein BaRGS_00034801, partial [Batillaria attramentaria]
MEEPDPDTAPARELQGTGIVGVADRGCQERNVSTKHFLRLSNLVATAAQSQHFFEGLGKMRERVAEENKDREPVPIFNKRLFAAHGSVVITAEARRVMAKNARVRPGQYFPLMSKSELSAMRCVVEGLRLVHRGQDSVKDALSHVISFESYSPYQYIVKRPFEAQLSCYYILHGAVQVTYDMDVTETRNVFQPDIIYNHGTGEFLGLVSPDGLSDDLSPPATVYTTEPSEFLRIDRQKFHAVVERIEALERQEKLLFLTKPSNVMVSLPREALEKVLPHVHKMEYPPNKTILHQGDTSDYLYFIISGRCQLARDVYIPEIDRDVCFYLDSREPDDFFGEECILTEEGGSTCHVTTTSHTVCFLMHKAALEVVSKEVLLHVLESKRHYFPPDEDLRDRGYRKSVWDGYKFREVRESLRERGCLHILSRDIPEKVRSRPPSAEYQKKENLFRFMMKGASYQPVSGRVRSAQIRRSPQLERGLSSRPRTALGMTIHPALTQRQAKRDVTPSPDDVFTPADDVVATPDDDVTATDDVEPRQDRMIEGEAERDAVEDGQQQTSPDPMMSSDDVMGSTPVTSSFVRMLERNGETDPRLLGRALEENPELARQLRLAWEIHQQDKHDGFTKTTVLVTMKTDDIVRKAKALAARQSFATADTEDDSEQWDTSLHKENRDARTNIAGDKLRAAFLRRKINVMQRKRAKVRADLAYRAAKPGQVPSSADRRSKETKKKPERFYLDEIQSKYQGLNPEVAEKKISSLGYEVMFISRLRRRSRSLHDIREITQEKEQEETVDNSPSRSFSAALSANGAPVRRRSAEEMTASGLAQNGYSSSVRKDAPITLRPSTCTLVTP